MVKETNVNAYTYTSILKRTTNDKRITATHLGLLSALFVCWQASGFRNPFQVNRKKLMGFSKIASTATYHKYIKQLDQFGYIRYRPSYHPVQGSTVYWLSEQRPKNEYVHSERVSGKKDFQDD